MDNPEEISHPNDCECHGTGWIEIQDPILDALVVARCPGPDQPRQLTIWGRR